MTCLKYRSEILRILQSYHNKGTLITVLKKWNFIQSEINFIKILVAINLFSHTLFLQGFWFVPHLHLLVHLAPRALHGQLRLDVFLALKHWLLQVHTFSNTSSWPTLNKRNFTISWSRETCYILSYLIWISIVTYVQMLAEPSAEPSMSILPLSSSQSKDNSVDIIFTVWVYVTVKLIAVLIYWINGGEVENVLNHRKEENYK